MKPDWRKVELNSEENVLVWLQVPQDGGDVSCTCYLTDTVNIYTEHLNTSSTLQFIGLSSGVLVGGGTAGVPD